MFCTKCGKAMKDHWCFCDRCGAPVRPVIPSMPMKPYVIPENYDVIDNNYKKRKQSRRRRTA